MNSKLVTKPWSPAASFDGYALTAVGPPRLICSAPSKFLSVYWPLNLKTADTESVILWNRLALSDNFQYSPSDFAVRWSVSKFEALSDKSNTP